MRSAGYRPRARSPVLMRRQPQPLRLGFKRAQRVEATAERGGRSSACAKDGRALGQAAGQLPADARAQIAGSLDRDGVWVRRLADASGRFIRMVAGPWGRMMGIRGYLGHA